jgi:hypothetical protein
MSKRLVFVGYHDNEFSIDEKKPPDKREAKAT